MTKLISAVKAGDSERVLALLLEGEDVNAVDTNGWSALHHIFHKSHVHQATALEIYQYLLQFGAHEMKLNHKNQLPHQVGQYNSLYMPSSVVLKGLYPDIKPLFFSTPCSIIKRQLPRALDIEKSWLTSLCYYLAKNYALDLDQTEMVLTFLLDTFGGCKLFFTKSKPTIDVDR